MARFSGPQGKGALRTFRAKARDEAEARQAAERERYSSAWWNDAAGQLEHFAEAVQEAGDALVALAAIWAARTRGVEE